MEIFFDECHWQYEEKLRTLRNDSLPVLRCSTQGDRMKLQIELSVNEIMLRFSHEEFPLHPGIHMLSGWMMALPSGDLIHRSRLQELARPIIDFGELSVPSLFRWVMADNVAIRYIAIFSLESITGLQYEGSYFDEDTSGSERNRNISRWRSWWLKRHSGEE